MLQIEEATHERGATGRIYSYRAEYSVGDTSIEWSADVLNGVDVEFRLRGSIPVTSPAIASIAEQAVRDAVVARIDAGKA
jgi:hypothetical protein